MWRIPRSELRGRSVGEESDDALIELPRSFTPDEISQLDRDTSTALSIIREWRNSFAAVNRVPLDVLSLIPAHLPSQGDQFRATFVCRRWRRTFVQHGALWSQISFRKGEAYAGTLLERAKGSALDIFVGEDLPTALVGLLPPYAQQIKSVEFKRTDWEDIRKFSEACSGPLPVLRSLEIATGFEDDQRAIIPQTSSPFFSNAINLEEFTFNSKEFQFSNQFVFPRLTTFMLWGPGTRAQDLFDFLKASPGLRTVEILTDDAIDLEGIPREMVVILPNLETFSLGTSGWNVYEVAMHISCPHARSTSIYHQMIKLNTFPNQELSPTPTLWNTIVHQYTRSPAEEVMLWIGPIYESSCITFRSSDESDIELSFGVSETDEDELEMSFGEIITKVFSQALVAIWTHPQLSHIKRLHIKYRATPPAILQVLDMAAGIETLFGSIGDLDKLTIEGGDLLTYFSGFGKWDGLPQLVFPPIKELTILHPLTDDEDCLDAIVALAESQHAKGIPFERATVRASVLPVAMAERLGQWVGIANCCEEVRPCKSAWD